MDEVDPNYFSTEEIRIHHVDLKGTLWRDECTGKRYTFMKVRVDPDTYMTLWQVVYRDIETGKLYVTSIHNWTGDVYDERGFGTRKYKCLDTIKIPCTPKVLDVRSPRKRS